MNGRSLRAAVAGFFLEPLEEARAGGAGAESPAGAVSELRAGDRARDAVSHPRSVSPTVAVRRRPVVVVAGTAPACGVTTVARGLAAALAIRAPAAAAAVTADRRDGAPACAAAKRLARSLGRSLAPEPSAAGRLCLLPGAEPAVAASAAAGAVPVVVDAGEPSAAPRAAACADAVVLVAVPSVEPALARVLAEALGRVGPRAVVVLNRAGSDTDAWTGACDLRLPEGRLGARLAAAGRGAGGALGRALDELADLVEPGG